MSMPALKYNSSLRQRARRALMQRQQELRAALATSDGEARVLYEEREADWEDQAANVSAAAGLDQVGERERAELARIEAALARLDAGEWGRCVGCHHAIAKDRLAAIPEATLCLACSERREPRR